MSFPAYLFLYDEILKIAIFIRTHEKVIACIEKRS